MLKEQHDFKVGEIVSWDGEMCTIVAVYPQRGKSPSGDILLRDNIGVEFLVNHREIEKV
ncbi:hypothetical protein SDC9_78484 [bioreactor metagenome]|uniref:Uncharacterized protein n=1 Tax=bioreactor metagenome TaxID=1076179 RepID=A0A644YUD8_9ZZZZ